MMGRFRWVFALCLALGVTAFAAQVATPSQQTNGALTQSAAVDGCVDDDDSVSDGCERGQGLNGAFASVLSKDGQNVYVSGSNDEALVTLSREHSSGDLEWLQCIQDVDDKTATNTEIPPCDVGRALDRVSPIEISPDGANAYAVAQEDDAVAIFARDPQTGRLTQLPGTAGCIAEVDTAPTSAPADGCASGRALNNARDLVVSPDGHNVYVASEVDSAVAVFSRDPATGELTQLPGPAGCIQETPSLADGCADGRAMNSTRGIVISPDGQNVYVSAQSSDSVAVLDRDEVTGELTQDPGPRGCISESGAPGCNDGHALTQALGITMSKDGGNVYVTSRSTASVATLVRDPATGELTQDPTTEGCESETRADCNPAKSLRQPFTVVVSQDGTNVYVAARDSDAVAAFARSATDGSLQQLPDPFGCISETGAATPAGSCTDGHALDDAAGVSISRDGKNVYVAAGVAGGSTSDAVAVLDRE